MKIVVCVKQVDGELNPLDGSALESALCVPGASVTLLCMGRQDCRNMLLQLSRLGVSKSILLSDLVFAGADTLATGYALSLAIRCLQPDYVFCGRQSVDGDTAQVGPGLAAWLCCPVLTEVLSIETITPEGVCVTTREGAASASSPAVLTFERSRTLRYPSLFSKEGQVEVLSASDILADPTRCGLTGSPTRVLETFESVLGLRHCRFVLPEAFTDILEAAKAQESSLIDICASEHNLGNVWIIGDSVRPYAEAIASSVTQLAPEEPTLLAAKIRSGKPDVVLWDATPWARRVAPQVAVLLRTGLCADCTHLETDGKELFMFRPARGGRIMAKIQCLTKPVMATLRTVQPSGDVLLSLGMGAREAMPDLLAIAKANGWETGASRLLTEKANLPYPMQVGLTGRSVAPKVYLACGISGAVQHTCAIQQAGTVIAVNPDKNARIFDYADYGIIARCEDILSSSLLHKPNKKASKP